MRLLALILAVLICPVVAAQETVKKKPAAKKQKQLAHKKATPEQIRKFNDLQKKR